MRLRTINQIKNLKNKKVLLRVDFNVPVEDGKVKNDYKIRKSLATIKYLLNKEAKVILVSHLGRPKGIDKSLSLAPARDELEKLIKQNIRLLDLEDKNTKEEIGKLSAGGVVFLENIRFFKDEEENSEDLARKLAGLADVFVLDGFAVAHRDMASVSGVAKLLPSYAGLLLEEEVVELSKIIQSPKHPFVLILGGAKMETKIPVLKRLLPLADQILIGGGVANTCLRAKGFEIGASLADSNPDKEAMKILEKKKIIFPLDFVVGGKDGTKAKIADADKNLLIENSTDGIFDIGPKTIKLYSQFINEAQTVVWNGALGYFEQAPYEEGTFAVAQALAKKSKSAFTVCGGGETVEVLEKLGLMKKMGLVSTGGGAMLEFLSGKKLPGVRAVS